MSSNIIFKTIKIPTNIKIIINYHSNTFNFIGKFGKLILFFLPSLKPYFNNNLIIFKFKNEFHQFINESYFSFIYRTLINILYGISKGYTSIFEINGVGYRFEIKFMKLILRIGFTYLISIRIPFFLKFLLKSSIQLCVYGPNKHQIGQFAEMLRKIKPANIYTNSGIKLLKEWIIIKRRKKTKQNKKLE